MDITEDSTTKRVASRHASDAEPPPITKAKPTIPQSAEPSSLDIMNSMTGTLQVLMSQLGELTLKVSRTDEKLDKMDEGLKLHAENYLLTLLKSWESRSCWQTWLCSLTLQGERYAHFARNEGFT